MKLKPLKSAKQELKAATIRDFSGGYNVLDDDLNLSTKFARKLFNMAILSDGTPTVRQGTRLFVDCNPFFSSANTKIINVEYFSSAVIVVGSNGDVLRVYGDGTVARIWDATIAAALPGAPTGWSATTFASFAQFNNDLIICNGVDKPLIVNAGLSVDYLQDLATNTNINTPVARYVVACDRYLVMAGDPVNPYRIHISARDASGTWFGDPDPNDATYVDVGSILSGASFIRGINAFRGQLVVGFVEGTIVASLGTYVSDAHTPQFEDPVEQYGAVSHRSMISYGDDMLMQDMVGVPSLKRTVFTGTLRPERVSDYIDSDMRTMIGQLGFSTIEDRCFAVYNQDEGQFMFFIPNSDDLATTTETRAFNYVYKPSLNIATWARYDGWNFTCGCRTAQGRLVFGDVGGKLWLYGFKDDPIYADFLNDPSIEDGTGRAITFDWELPWSDINKRMRTKNSKYISFDTSGTATFSVSMYVDRFVLNEDLADAPLLTMEMVGGDAGGFGSGYSPYGGGRNTAHEKLWAWPAKFMLMKLRMRGAVKLPLKFASISILYQDGGYFR